MSIDKIVTRYALLEIDTSSAHPQLSLIFSVQKSYFFTSFQRSSDRNQVVQLELDTGYNKQQKYLKWNRSRETKSSGNSLEVEYIIFSSLSEGSVSFCHWPDASPLLRLCVSEFFTAAPFSTSFRGNHLSCLSHYSSDFSSITASVMVIIFSLCSR